MHCGILKIFTICVLLFAGSAEVRADYQVTLADVDSNSTSPTGQFRWRDAADNIYSADYRDWYNYTLADVHINYNADVNGLYGTLNASNLKPYFAYQLKLVGNSDIDSVANKNTGLAGRWWQQQWGETSWIDGKNLNNKGDGTSPNPNDDTYFVLRDVNDPCSPTGKHYRFTGYLVLDYFITDINGDAELSFRSLNSYHVLWKTTQSYTYTADDGPIKTVLVYPDPCSPAYDINYPASTIEVFGEWERLPVDQVIPADGDYQADFVLTEECFHSCSVEFGGCWASAMAGAAKFRIGDCLVDVNDLDIIVQQWLSEGDQLTFDFDDSNDVDFGDYSGFAKYWQDQCPYHWPVW